MGERVIQYIDYAGFSFNGVHSSQLGIYRVSDGSRYNENLLPTIQDKTIPIPGGDGTYFFDSFYTQKPFNLQIAFDSLTEKDLRDLKKLFSIKKPVRLIFDETPFKYYLVKATGSPSVKTIAFEEECESTDDGAFLANQTDNMTNISGIYPYDASETYMRRIYKGEGTLSLIAYTPYAKSVYKYIDEVPEIIMNIEEWRIASGLLPTKGEYDTPQLLSNHYLIKTYNSGDTESDYMLYFIDTNKTGEIPAISLHMDGEGTFMDIDKIKLIDDDGIRINTRLELIEGVKLKTESELARDPSSKYKITGNIYNGSKKSGLFLRLPIGASELEIYSLNNGELPIPESITYGFSYL